MQVRVFESVDMATGLKEIKDELGPDALILSTRTIRNGKRGLLGKAMIEITAAVDADFPSSANKTAQPNPAPKSSGFSHRVNEPVEQFLTMPAPSAPRSSKRRQQAVKSNKNVSNAPAKPNGPEDKALQGEVDELKDLVRNLAGQISKLSDKDGSEPPPPDQTTVKESPGTTETTSFASQPIPDPLLGNPLRGDQLLTELTDRGISSETARSITTFLRQNLTEQQLTEPASVKATIVAMIEDFIKVEPPVFKTNSGQQRIALVGPTGVGKTTTLAKIAASCLAKHSQSIALITIDTYRIAAVEQLKVYGEIMNLPVDVVINPEQLKEAIEKQSDKDLILIDTAGRSPRDSYSIDELGTFLTPELGIDIHLVLSAGTRENELLDTIERFSKLSIKKTIFTKIDECSSLGVLLNIQAKSPKPLSYLTNGQRVPEDLLEISPKIIAELIMSQHEGSMHD